MKLKTKVSRQRLLSFLCIFMVTVPYARAQVTIGENVDPQDFSILEISTNTNKGGLRLPQLTTLERNALDLAALDDETNEKSKGLTIFNLTSNCYEYWNGSSWVSLCSGNAQIRFIDNTGTEVNPSENAILNVGGDVGPFTPIEEKPCTGKASPYSINIVSGENFTTVEVTNESTGAFTIEMLPNLTAKTRTAIVRVANNCTGEFRDLLFTQEANSQTCDPSVEKPVINVTNNGSLCQGGAVYMYVTNPVAGATYIWTLNDIELGQGTFYTATRPGNYVVYVGGIGCIDNASDRVRVETSQTQAPSGGIVLYASNNGVICGSSSLSIMAYNIPETGTLTWYKNGIKDNTKTGNQITLVTGDAGVWFAVVEEGTCTSTPSDAIVVTEVQSSNSLAMPEVSVNGRDINSITSFCKNGRLDMSLSNFDTYSTSITVKWYDGLNLLGEGENISVIAPIADSFVLRCVVSDNTGTLCSSEVIKTKALTGTAPNSPGIAGTPYICGGLPAMLTATVSGSGTYQYEWYRNDVLLTETSQTLAATETGVYRVAVIEDQCISTLSQPITVQLSDFPSLSWAAGADRVQPDEIKTYQVNGTFNPTEYTWTVDDPAAVILNGQGTNIVNIKFPNKGEAGNPHLVKISVTGANTCGESDVLEKTVSVSPSCTPISIRNTNINPASGKMIAGNTLTMSVTATGTNLSYQWKLNGVPIAGATSTTYTVDNAQPSHSGTYTCTVTSNCEGVTSQDAIVGTIDVLNMASVSSGTGIIVGENCFDIAAGNNNATCGSLALRQKYQANFTQTHTYTFVNKGTTNTNLQFLIEDPLGAVESYTVQPSIPTMLADGGRYVIAIKYKQELMTTAIGRDNNNPIPVTIYATYQTLGNNTVYKNSIDVKIKDCDCCRIMTDGQGYEYTTYEFGDAGCWMTQNLRTTSKSGLSLARNYGQSTSAARYYYPNGLSGDGNGVTKNLEYGILYNWAAAANICPTGWEIPSDAQWNALEQEIATNKEKYASTTTETPWNSTASTQVDVWRGAWGQSMKTPLAIGNATNGYSNTDGTGFNIYMIGFMWEGNGNPSAFSSGTYFWTSTNGSTLGGKARKITRHFSVIQSGVFRTNNFTYDFIPVRCKKK
ncbi:MAG: hypothetical protein LIO93_02065 [Bacteroidales bacterium]|nr:hypothetical protein [Bacteroidales bacterium]